MVKNTQSDDLYISLLGFLYDQPKHGYELFKEISDLSGIGLVWRVKMGHLYAMLHRLEEENWVECTVTQAGNRPQRNQFNITASGKARFDDWQTQPVQKGRDFRIVFLLKMYFAMQRGGKRVNSLIKNQKITCENWLKDFNANQKTDDAAEFRQIVVNFRLTQIKGYQEWLDWCKVHIGTKK
jgi:PadR family transcriptional regulator, regulatory protein AphA